MKHQPIEAFMIGEQVIMQDIRDGVPRAAPAPWPSFFAWIAHHIRAWACGRGRI